MSESLTFSNPQEELAYLRSKVLEAEKKLEGDGASPEREKVASEVISSYKEEALPALPAERHEAAAVHAAALTEGGKEAELGEVMSAVEEKGVLHALAVVEKLKGWRLEDDFHSYVVDLVREGLPIRGIKEKGPIYQALHMTLYEVLLPKGAGRTSADGGASKPLAELVKSMEQLYAGLLTLGEERKDEPSHIVFELANPEGEEDTRAFVSVPRSHKDLFERQLLSIFPNAKLFIRERDYNIWSDASSSLGASARLSAHPAYPIKTFEEFGEDPLNVILSGFSKLPAVGAGAALQIVFRPVGNAYAKKYEHALVELKKGKKAKEILKRASIGGEIAKTLGDMFITKKKKEGDSPVVDDKAVEAVMRKLGSPIIETNIRLAVSSQTEAETEKVMHNFQSAFNQFESSPQGFRWEPQEKSDFYRAFTFRLFRAGEVMPLNTKELSSILHFHTEALAQHSTLKQSAARSAPPPLEIASEGTLIGINSYQGYEKKIYIAPEDRLRHLYVIGQTGTGKSSLLKNMIYEDIMAGSGVCMIDPHGSDIQEVLGYVPPERAQDVIYFDPASTERPMALNMLEYDPNSPEQKTFVVNELFSIFQKLYGGVPESMGPMFEQYFRNATMLVIEDPETGCTLLDVSRVMSNKEYRDLKISRCKNPIVVQFWTEIAAKAGGEAALANIVPYITSKFDIFLANDIMRPIIAQEKSSFNFRDVMDQKKILLVNLSKGRLGDINANLIGLILVGKILMAALSRVNSIDRDMPPFYLTIDEFQNITTNSIATILSEARKYKLSLTIAHQFIAQIDEKIRDAVIGNVGSICAFRVGNDDAEYLENQFSPIFNAKDIANIENLHAYVKMLVHGKSMNPFDIKLVPWHKSNPEVAAELKKLSSLKYGRDKAEVEREIMEKYKKREQTV